MAQFGNHKVVGEIGKLLNRLGDPALDFSADKECLILEKLQAINAILDEQQESEIVEVHEIQQESQLEADRIATVSEKKQPPFIFNENMADYGFSEKLQKHVSDIKNQIVRSIPISEKLARHIQEHDQIRTVGHITNEDLWNGASGVKPISAYWSMVSYIWKNAPDFFEDFDKDREITEHSAVWNQKYFDEQRNFLRHNFSLERLCHIIMVHEKIHDISEEMPVRPKCTVIKGSNFPFDDAPASTENPSLSSKGRKKLFFYGISILIVLLLLVACAIIIHKNMNASGEGDKKMPIGRRTIPSSSSLPSRRQNNPETPKNGDRNTPAPNVSAPNTKNRGNEKKSVMQTVIEIIPGVGGDSASESRSTKVRPPDSSSEVN